jgi:hypothetical protein
LAGIREPDQGKGYLGPLTERKNLTGFTGLKERLTGFLISKILNPVNPEKILLILSISFC